MSKEGEDLERIVEACHKQMEADHTIVTWNDHVEGRYSKSKRQIDVSLKSKDDPNFIRDIVECKDRSRVQDVNFIVSLEGNRDDIGAESAIAVTTTGYSKGAVNYADSKGIDLRVVKEVDQEELKWLQCKEIKSEIKMGNFFNALLDLVNKKQALDNGKLNCNKPIFKFKNETKRISINDLWKATPVDQLNSIFVGMKPGDPKVRRTINIQFLEENPLQYLPNRKPINLKGIILDAEIWIDLKTYPLLLTRTYRAFNGDEAYTDIGEYDFEQDGKPRLLRIYRTHVPDGEGSRISIAIYEKPNAKKHYK